MAKPLKPFVRGGGYYPSSRWTPLVYPGGYTTANGGGQPEPEPVLKTVTGALIHITDALALPAKALTVNVEPVQDLHGYDSPWPAGGGKNLLDLAKCSTSSAYELTTTLDQETGIWTISGTPSSQSASLAFSFCFYSDYSLSGKGYAVQLFPISGTPIKNSYGLRTESDRAIAIMFDSVANPTINVSFKVSVAATSQTAWTPYSNICPISGRTSATIYHSGADTSDPTTYTIQFGDTVYGGTLDVTGGKMVVDAELEVFNRIDGTNLLSQINSFGPQSSRVGTIGDYARIAFAVNTSVDQSKYNRMSSTYKYKMCNLAKHSFAYNEQSAHWYRNTVLYLFLPTALVGSTAQSVYDYLVSIKDTTPLSIWTPLNEPFEITLTPTQIEMLLGENNLWADAGDLTLTYYAEGNASTSEALGILLGGTYNNPGGADDVSDDEALGILLGGS